MKSKVLAGFLAAGLLAVFLFPQLSFAQAKYPSRQITYLVTFDPGGQSDRTARLQQPHLNRLLGQQVIIDYKVGGGGALGWKELARAKPDGYFIAGFNIPHIILQPLQQEVGYKTDQIVPVVTFQRTPLAIAVLNTSPHKTLKDFVGAAKASPGKLTIGGSAVFSGPHFAVMRMEKMLGIKLTYVPFTGAAPQMTAFLGGHTDTCMGNSDDLTRFKDKLRVLAFGTETRFPAFPDAPTFKELGYDLVEGVERGVAVPKGTPKEIIAVLEKAFMEVAKDPVLVKEQVAQGFVPLAMNHAESMANLAKLTKIYTELAKEIKAAPKK
ncbi:MAG: tripartite tricarboxylate transporter substrate binding protein [Thermodesulfobacteriota bacterium]